MGLPGQMVEEIQATMKHSHLLVTLYTFLLFKVVDGYPLKNSVGRILML